MILFGRDFDNERLRHTLRDMRQFTGRQLADFCQQRMPEVFKQVINNPQRTDRARQFWQQSRHPVAIWTEPSWRSKVNYSHDNSRRKGLVLKMTAWRFSSAGYWLLDPLGETDVRLTGIEWWWRSEGGTARPVLSLPK